MEHQNFQEHRHQVIKTKQPKKFPCQWRSSNKCEVAAGVIDFSPGCLGRQAGMAQATAIFEAVEVTHCMFFWDPENHRSTYAWLLSSIMSQWQSACLFIKTVTDTVYYIDFITSLLFFKCFTTYLLLHPFVSMKHKKNQTWKLLPEFHQSVSTGRWQVYGRNIVGGVLFLPVLKNK